ncbi:MAG: ribonuclease HIII [Verrucomicrobiales bacterium]|nr:ribonuclease HIII [Verrucomicrobiales bacterium]
MPAPSTYTYKLTEEQGEQLEAILRRTNYKFNEVPYTRFAAKRDKVSVAFYTSGKLVVQGKEAKEFIEFVLEPEILLEARLGYEDVLNPELLLPRIGVDESGKGDFFGPLTIAGVYVNESVVKAWREQDIRDSKNISSDKKIADYAEIIQKTEGVVYDVVTIGNEAYNRLYTKMRSVNKVLAWGHARVIENLMGRRYQMDPEPVRAISDQFASDKATVGKALMQLGREIELIQRHKAESDLAVAAASILARHAFVTKLKDLGTRHELEFPKGASKQVEAVGREFVEQEGADELSKVAKMHFRTSYRVRGLPEPARKEWRKR